MGHPWLRIVALTLSLSALLGVGNSEVAADPGATPLAQLQVGADKLAADCGSQTTCAGMAAQFKSMVEKLIGEADGGLPSEQDLKALEYQLATLKNKLDGAPSEDLQSEDSQLGHDIQTLNELIGALLEEAAAEMKNIVQYA